MVEKSIISTHIDSNHSDKGQRDKSTFMRFFPAVAAIIAASGMFALLNLAAIYALDIISLFIPLTNQSAILTILLISQMSGALLTFFLLIPIFKVKNVDNTEPIRGSNARRAFLIYIGLYSIALLSNLLFIYITSLLDITPQTGYGSILVSEDVMDDAYTILIYFIAPTIGAGVYEEMVYRRMVIPRLEKSGMAPFTAALSSAALFAIGHFPNDLFNGNIAGGIIHVWGVFLIGTALGAIYIFSRKVIYPITLHALYNLVSFLGPYVVLTGSNLILAIYSITMLLIIGGGAFAAVYIVVQYLRKRNYDWIKLVKEDSEVKPRKGILGYMLIGILAFTGIILMEIMLAELVYAGWDYYLALILANIGYASIMIIFAWLGHQNLKTQAEIGNKLIKMEESIK